MAEARKDKFRHPSAVLAAAEERVSVWENLNAADSIGHADIHANRLRDLFDELRRGIASMERKKNGKESEE